MTILYMCSARNQSNNKLLMKQTILNLPTALITCELWSHNFTKKWNSKTKQFTSLIQTFTKENNHQKQKFSWVINTLKLTYILMWFVDPEIHEQNWSKRKEESYNLLINSKWKQLTSYVCINNTWSMSVWKFQVYSEW